VTDFICNDPAGTGRVTAQLLAHCRHELPHKCWKIILDDEFLHAYEHGIVVDCGDGVCHRLYPRIFVYSADYPEKYFVFYIYTFLILIVTFPGFWSPQLGTWVSVRVQGVKSAKITLVRRDHPLT
jgi:hypothetical protein